MEISSTEGKIFFVSDYGAYPNDNLDNTIGIQLAINEAIKYGGVSEIDFGYGIYAISASIEIYNAMNLTIKGKGIDQTFLIGYNPVTIFFADHCQRLKLTSFSIDYNPLPFTAGYVVSVDTNYLDVQIVAPHQTDEGRQVACILRYDPMHMRPAFGPNTYEIYQQLPDNASTTIVAPGVLRLPIRDPTRFCQGMGDDGLNVHGVLFHVAEVIDSNTIIIESTNGGGLLDVGVGTNLEISSNQQPFTVHANGTVASLVFNSTSSRKITFTSPVNVSLGDWVCLTDTPLLIIRNLTVSHNRARGVLLETRNIDIRQLVA